MDDPLDPREILRAARRVALRSRRLVSEAMSGEFRSVFRGSGMEFESVREYAVGDDVRALDWNVTARFGRPFVKQFVEARERSFWLVVDRSASLRFGTATPGARPRSKAEAAAELAAILAVAAARQHDRVALLAFTDRVEAVVPPSRGPGLLERLLYTLLARPLGGAGTDLDAALVALEGRVPRRSTIFLISDFDAPFPARVLRRLARRHDVIAFAVRDPRESELDGLGLIRGRDPETGRVFVLDAADRVERAAFSRAAEDRRAHLRADLRSCGVDLLELSSREPLVPRLLRFLQGRARHRGVPS